MHFGSNHSSSAGCISHYVSYFINHNSLIITMHLFHISSNFVRNSEASEIYTNIEPVEIQYVYVCNDKKDVLRSLAKMVNTFDTNNIIKNMLIINFEYCRHACMFNFSLPLIHCHLCILYRVRLNGETSDRHSTFSLEQKPHPGEDLQIANA